MVPVVDHEDLVEPLHLLGLATNLLDRFPRGGRTEHGHHMRGHQAAGGLLVVGQEAIHLGAVLHLGEDPLLLLRIEILEEVGGVVVRHLVDDVGGVFRLECGEGVLGVLLLRHFRQRLAGDLGRQGPDRGQPLVVVERGEDIGEVDRFHVEREGHELVHAPGA